MQLVTLLTTLFYTLATSSAIPATNTDFDIPCGIIKSSVANNEVVERRTTELTRGGGCHALEGMTFYYRVDSGCACSFYT
jgi:hypothetical protein